MKQGFAKSIKISLVLALLAATGYAVAQQAPKPENLIKWRQSAFSVIAWNTGRIKANVEGTYNKDEVVKAANTIAALSKSGIDSLFVAGTEQGKGWHDTSAKAETFKDTKHFEDLLANFGKEAGDLAGIAASGDQAAVKAQYGKLTRTCKACHDDFKAKD
ncbi:MAG TPA: cytochrome c [Burkholderiaceae bacterium]|jgi:cytochrome c556